MVIMGYKMKNGSKDYTIKSYRDGGLVKTTSYKDGGKVEKEEAQDSWTTTMSEGMKSNSDLPGPFQFGTTKNVIKRILGLDYLKRDKNKSPYER